MRVATNLRVVPRRAEVMTLPLSRPRRRRLTAFVWGLVVGLLVGLVLP